MLLESLRRALLWASDFVWGPWTLALLLGTGLFLTFATASSRWRFFRRLTRTLIPKQQEAHAGS